jgi:hypothetical protein
VSIIRTNRQFHSIGGPVLQRDLVYPIGDLDQGGSLTVKNELMRIAVLKLLEDDTKAPLIERMTIVDPGNSKLTIGPSISKLIRQRRNERRNHLIKLQAVIAFARCMQALRFVTDAARIERD